MDAAQFGSIAPKHAHDVIAPQQAVELVSEYLGVAILTQPSGRWAVVCSRERSRNAEVCSDRFNVELHSLGHPGLRFGGIG